MLFLSLAVPGYIQPPLPSQQQNTNGSLAFRGYINFYFTQLDVYITNGRTY